MRAELESRLSQLSHDVNSGQVERAAFFWLKVFVDAAVEGGGEVRSDHWVRMGLAAASEIPGLAVTALTPRQQGNGTRRHRPARNQPATETHQTNRGSKGTRNPDSISVNYRQGLQVPTLAYGSLRQLISNYGLFRFVRMKDSAELRGEALSDLDWQRKYRVSLLPEFAADLAELQTWATETWAEWRDDVLDAQQVALEAALDRYRPQGRAALLEVLHEAQNIYGGWLPREVLEQAAAALNVPVSDVYGVTEFYEMFHTRPVGQNVIRICQDAPCALAGADALTEKLCQRLGIQPGETTTDSQYTLELVRCLGMCDCAPAALVNLDRYGSVDPARPEILLNGQSSPPPLAIGGLVKLALANVGVVDPASLADYRAQGGLAALQKALRTMTPVQVIEEVKTSKLVGRGGAAFPTGLKWEFAARNPGPRYLICNADESEPGAFKDRVLMDGDPFRVLEGIVIACYAIGAEQGFVYVRGEYGRGYERFGEAVRQLEVAGYLGQNILGSDFSCHIQVRRGAGAYICGEETALMESIEGKRGFPRLRPPFPTDAGLWGRPTVINNVETLAKVPPIIVHGGRWYNALGTPESAGTKLLAVSGSVVRPGVYEVPFGVPLRHLIYDLAGGLRPGRTMQAVLTGGAAGTFLTAEHLDTPITFEDFKKVGGTIGAGTIMVFDDTVNMREVLRRIADFFAHESCGKCYPCQMGTQRQAEIMARVVQGQARPEDAATLIELGTVMTDTSICGLGQTAAQAIVNAQRHWPVLFEAA